MLHINTNIKEKKIGKRENDRHIQKKFNSLLMFLSISFLIKIQHLF